MGGGGARGRNGNGDWEEEEEEEEEEEKGKKKGGNSGRSGRNSRRNVRLFSRRESAGRVSQMFLIDGRAPETTKTRWKQPKSSFFIF